MYKGLKLAFKSFFIFFEFRNFEIKQAVFFIPFVVILATTPNWLWSARIHNAIAVAMSMCVAVGNKVVDSPVCLSL